MMTVKQFIEELQKLDQDMLVCGESETGNWDLTQDDIIVKPVGPHERAVVVGYSH